MKLTYATGKMNAWIFPLVIVDVIVTTLTSCRGDCTTSLFTRDLDLTRSVLDLWLLGVLRVCLVLSWISMVTCWAGKHETRRDVVCHVTQMALLLMWMYNGGKLLAMAENMDVLHDK